MAEFVDGETLHFIMGPNGELYACRPDDFADLPSLGSAVVSRVDPKTNTIYFSTPLPEHIKR